MITLSDVQRRVGVEPDGKWGPQTLAAVAKALGIEAPAMRFLKTAPAFFAGVRQVTGRLNITQVNVINSILDAAKHWPTSWVAYALATAWHECRFEPVKEKGGDGYLHRMYDIGGSRPKLARQMGNVNPGDGVKFAGRGLVQLTWRSNYRAAGQALGIDLEANPELALDLDIATRILVWGMEGGKFTGSGLGDFLPNELGSIPQFISSRRIINGTDRDDDIAEYAADFQSALIDGGWNK